MRKRLRYLMFSLPQFLMAKSIVFSFPALWADNRTKGRNREENESPIIQEKVVSNLLLHLEMHKSMGPNGIHPKVPRELGKDLYQATFNHLPGVLAYQRDPNWVEVSKCDAHLQEMLEGGSRELRACQPDLVSGKATEQIILSAINDICRTTRGSDSLRAGLWKRSCLSSPIFLWESDPFSRWGKGCGCCLPGL